jgi:hypothetical protein
MQGTRADITSIKATQSNHSAFLIEHGQRLDQIQAAMATKEDAAALKAIQVAQDAKLDLILQLLQQKG